MPVEPASERRERAPSRRGQTLLALVVLAIGGVIAAVLGLFAYIAATATPLHPDPQQVSSVARSEPSSEWAAAVARSRELIRAGIIEQNLPGSKAHVQTDGQGHYEATVIAAAFAGKRSLQRHQLVYGTLESRVGREIHALAIHALTPEEWQARSPPS